MEFKSPDKKETMITKIKNFLKWIWNECKDWHTLILLLCVIIVMYSPVWGGYLLHAVFGWAWCSAVASAYLLFWAGPFTPFFPMCIGITLSIKKVMQVKSGKHKTSAIKADFAIQNKSHNDDAKNKDYSITFDKLFWLFLIGSVMGVVIEGLFCLVTKGKWESHVISAYLPFNALYGMGSVLFYVGAVKLREKNLLVRVIFMTLAATLLELFSGLFLKYGLGMRAWNYAHNFLNYKGIICLKFSLAWAIVAFCFCRLYPYISKILVKFSSKKQNCFCAICSVILAIDMSLAGISIIRWSDRHYGFEAETQFEKEIDIEAPDEWMESRFMDWHFLE